MCLSKTNYKLSILTDLGPKPIVMILQDKYI